MVVDSGRIQNHRPPHNNHSNNTLHTLVVEWSIFKTSRVRARENPENRSPIPRDSSRYHPDRIPSIYKQYHVY